MPLFRFLIVKKSFLVEADKVAGCWAAGLSLSGRMSFPCILAAGRDPARPGLRVRSRSREPPGRARGVTWFFFFPFLESVTAGPSPIRR